MNENDDIRIVYHIACIGIWETIVKEQLQLLFRSGLGHSSSRIYIQVVGIQEEEHAGFIEKFFIELDYFSKIQFSFHKSLQEYEFPSIRKSQEIAEEFPLSKILYFHTKGTSYGLNKYGQQWRYFMEYFNITKWKDAINFLNKFDICGVDWGQAFPDQNPYFAGNFWWANAAYIKKCSFETSSRYSAELFIGSANPYALEVASSINNPKLTKYLTPTEIERLKMNFPGGLQLFAWYEAYYKFKYFIDDSELNEYTLRSNVQIQYLGWLMDSCGTINENLKLEGFTLQINSMVPGKIVYRSYVEDYGWQDWVENNVLSGTVGISKGIHAIQIFLTDELEELFEIKYRVRLINEGWQDWVRNGNVAGNLENLFLEAYEIKLELKY